MVSILTARLGSSLFLLRQRLTRLDALDNKIVQLRDRVGGQGVDVELDLIVVLRSKHEESESASMLTGRRVWLLPLTLPN